MQQCWETPANVVFDFLEHLQEFPPEYLILRAVHLKTGAAKRKGPLTEKEHEEQRKALGSVMGPSQPLPPELRELLEWGREQDKLMRTDKPPR